MNLTCGFEGKRFGVTDFLNPDSLHRPVDEVANLLSMTASFLRVL